jgi:hypothetical protein
MQIYHVAPTPPPGKPPQQPSSTPAQSSTPVPIPIPIKPHSDHPQRTSIRASSISPRPPSTFVEQNPNTQRHANDFNDPMFGNIGSSGHHQSNNDHLDAMSTGSVSPSKRSGDEIKGRQSADSKPFKNSSKIVHAFGPGGIAPLAPLSQKKEEKSVIPVMVSWTGGGRTVHVTGTFNNWKQKIRLTKR